MKKAIRIAIKSAAILLLIAVALFGSYKIYMSFELEGTPSSQTWSESDEFDTQSVSTLSMREGEDFQILLFSDIQLFGNPFEDNKALALVDEMVLETQPDFIMTSGDNAMFILSDIMSKKFAAQMESYEIPWGVTLGNHDSEGRADRAWLGNLYENADYSLFQSGPSNIQGIGNYVINIADSSNQSVYTLIMMDSNIEREYETEKYYDYIYPDQIAWYEWVVASQPDVPSMLIFHIPLPEFADAVAAVESGTIDSSLYFGEIREKVCAPLYNTGLFDAVKELESTTHIFNGHDHVNNLSIDYEGVRLTYGLKTGTCSYSNDDLQGATLITIKAGTGEVVVEHVFR